MSTISIAQASRQFSQMVNRAAYGRDVVVLTSHGQPKAVLLGLEAFDQLVGMREVAEEPLQPLDEFQGKFQAALAEAGYDTRQKILDLVRDIKTELAIEAGLLPGSATPTAETE